MKTFVLICCVMEATLMVCRAQLPQKFDSLYKTLYARELCRLLREKPDVLLFDVRTPGEYDDTSSFASLNLGRIRNAINFPIDSLRNSLPAMEQYRNKTLVLYCSHSQRSRRVSKLLSENGFTNFYNLNGGMSSLTQLNESEFPCKEQILQTNLRYEMLTPTETIEFYAQKKNVVTVDVRPAVQFTNQDTADHRNIGKIRGAINIPYNEFQQRLSELQRYKNFPVLVYGLAGDGDAARAASLLVQNGFASVYNLLGGLQGLLIIPKASPFLEQTPPFSLLDAPRTLALLKQTPTLTIYDLRPKIEFDNKDERAFRNLGRLKNAIHVSLPPPSEQIFPADKRQPILLYGAPDAQKLAKILAEKGYSSLFVLESLYDFVWSGANVETCKDAKTFLMNFEGLY